VGIWPQQKTGIGITRARAGERGIATLEHKASRGVQRCVRLRALGC
jgi:hypothetical protein